MLLKRFVVASIDRSPSGDRCSSHTMCANSSQNGSSRASFVRASSMFVEKMIMTAAMVPISVYAAFSCSVIVTSSLKSACAQISP